MGVVGLALVACESSPPILAEASSRSNFAGAVYKGTTAVVRPRREGVDTYRVYSKGATGFVSMSAVRQDAEDRASAFCARQGKEMESIAETTANPPFILGNFPRIEIIFDCVGKPVAPNSAESGDPKYAKIRDLKRLLDEGAITPAEYEREKVKILSQP